MRNGEPSPRVLFPIPIPRSAFGRRFVLFFRGWLVFDPAVRVNLGIWEKLTKLVVFLLFVLGVVAVCVWYLPLIRQNERMRQDIARLDMRLKAGDEKAKSLLKRVEALRNDPRMIERYARANLGYAKPGETVIRFEEPKETRNAQRGTGAKSEIR